MTLWHPRPPTLAGEQYPHLDNASSYPRTCAAWHACSVSLWHTSSIYLISVVVMILAAAPRWRAHDRYVMDPVRPAGTLYPACAGRLAYCNVWDFVNLRCYPASHVYIHDRVCWSGLHALNLYHYIQCNLYILSADRKSVV